jgi:hypothetical protein
VRRGLLALERELVSPSSHPALRLIGIADAEVPGAPPADAARDHDQALADTEEAGWSRSPSGKANRATGRSRKKRRGQ